MKKARYIIIKISKNGENVGKLVGTKDEMQRQGYQITYIDTINWEEKVVDGNGLFSSLWSWIRNRKVIGGTYELADRLEDNKLILVPLEHFKNSDYELYVNYHCYDLDTIDYDTKKRLCGYKSSEVYFSFVGMSKVGNTACNFLHMKHLKHCFQERFLDIPKLVEKREKLKKIFQDIPCIYYNIPKLRKVLTGSEYKYTGVKYKLLGLPDIYITGMYQGYDYDVECYVKERLEIGIYVESIEDMPISYSRLIQSVKSRLIKNDIKARLGYYVNRVPNDYCLVLLLDETVIENTFIIKGSLWGSIEHWEKERG